MDTDWDTIGAHPLFLERWMKDIQAIHAGMASGAIGRIDSRHDQLSLFTDRPGPNV